MANEFLNKSGLTYLWGRITALFATKTELSTLDDRVDDLEVAGGEPNTIESVTVNGTAVTPDQSKVVALTIPTTTSALTNNGDGTSNFATEAYVTTNGGKIDKIKVNNVEQTITSKEVNITMPTKVSDLTNDSSYQTATDVSTAIATAVASAYKYKGSVATVSALPSVGNTVGDVYDVQENGSNYAWDGTKWDALGQIIDTSTLWSKSEMTAITTGDIDTIIAG